MSNRMTVYLDDKIINQVKRYENKSKLVNEALNMYFINEDYFISKRKCWKTAYMIMSLN